MKSGLGILVIFLILLLLFLFLVHQTKGQSADPVAYWKFDEGSGNTAYDSSGNNHVAFLNGTVWGDGILGKSLNFDGKNDFVEVVDSSGLNPSVFTLSVWVYFNNLPAQYGFYSASYIINKGIDNQPGSYALALNRNKPQQVFSLGIVESQRYGFLSTMSPDLNKWYNLVGIYDGAALQLYINGVLEGKASINVTRSTNNANILMGKQNAPGYEYWLCGLLDEVKIYDYARSSNQILQDYQSVMQQQYSLTTNVVGNGSIARSPNLTSYGPGTSVNLIANPSSGWMFSGWSGDLSGSANPAQITINADKIVTATFTPIPPNQYSLTVNVVGSGSVSKNPNQPTFDSNTVVSLTPQPSSGWMFSGWSGDLSGSANPAQITINADKIVTATFTPIPPNQYSLTVNVVGSGSVSKNPNQPTFDSNTVVSLTPQPSSGWMFSGWSGDLSGSSNPATITMDSSKIVTATFTQNQTSGTGGGDIEFRDQLWLIIAIILSAIIGCSGIIAAVKYNKKSKSASTKPKPLLIPSPVGSANCPKCGTLNPQNFDQCSHCGAKMRGNVGQDEDTIIY